MKHLKNLIAILLTAVIAVSVLVVPSSAAGISSAKPWSPDTNKSIKADAAKKATGYYKITITGAGEMSFYTGKLNVTDASRYALLNAKGKTLRSGKLSSLETKTFNINKAGTYYLKITLGKGESVKYFRYMYYEYGAYPTATEEWLKNHKLTDNEIKQIKTAFSPLVWNGIPYFGEGEINEHQALDWLINNCLGFINPYGFDYEVEYSHRITFGRSADEYVENYKKNGGLCGCLSGKAVDDTLYHLFGIKATHEINSMYKFYYDGVYFYSEGAKGCYDDLEYISNERLSDGRFLVKFVYHQMDFEKTEDIFDPVYINSDVYSLISVHQTDGKNYIRIHGIYKEKPDV
jgi:hypothetical protein